MAMKPTPHSDKATVQFQLEAIRLYSHQLIQELRQLHSAFAWYLLIGLIPILVALFFADGETILEQTVARFGFMSDTLVDDMLYNIEYNYYYDEVFDSDKYRQLREELSDKPFKTYGDFEEYISSISVIINQTMFNKLYDSVI